MAIAKENVVVTTATTGAQTLDMGKDPLHTTTLMAVSGTYGTLTYTWQGSVDGTNFENIYCIDMSAGTPITGGTTIAPSDNTSALFKFDTAGLIAIRMNILGLVTVTTLTVTPYNFSSVGTPITYSNQTGGTFSGAQTFGGGITMSDATNLAVGTTTGTKIGTATAQKIAFWNATPIVQPANTVDYVTMLTNLGLRATGGTAAATFPGALSCAALTATSVAATGTVALTDNMTITDAKNIILNATTGTIIGTATTQKLSFYNATPITQPAANSDTTTGAAGSTTNVFLNTTFTGAGGTAAFTVGGVVTKLKALGLLAP